MIIKCPKCQYEIVNMETFELLGHTADYWIELETKAETLNVTKLLEEIVHLKAKIYDFEQIVKDFDIIQRQK
jgi:hypothetical protein